MGELNEEEMKKLREMIESWDSAQIGISVFKVIGDLIKWVAAVLAAIAILWAAASHGLHKP
jgi:Co/Zn/Cd efflux system component